QLTDFAKCCAEAAGHGFADHTSLHRFSVEQFRQFWRLFLDWSAIRVEGEAGPVCTDDSCERATFFPGLRLSYAENLLARLDLEDDAAPALTAIHADGRAPDRLSRGELRDAVGRAAAALRALGIEPGDRVVAILNNDAEAVIGCLAAVALGATFSTAAPEMGAAAILSRFSQLDPKLLICHTGDGLGGGRVNARLEDVAGAPPTLRAIVLLGAGDLPALPPVELHRFSDLIAAASVPLASWPRLPFNHPLFILFSSGTKGAPKCIVHGAGGTLLEHLKEHRLHGDLRPGEKLFFHTSCAWMMWNWQLSALVCGAEIVLFDGAVVDPGTLWQVVADEHVNVFGTSPAYIKLCQDRGFLPGRELALHDLPAVLSTGSILHDQQFDWIVRHVKPVPVQSISGGTDILGCFVLGHPDLPVWRGESQCRSLGLDVQAVGQHGDAYGELVCRNPFPSRPLGFYGDASGARFHAAYFCQNAGMWTHGDFVSFTPDGTARLHGRSDGIINVRGIRVGPAEIYAVLQDVAEIREALAVEQARETEPGGARLVLFVVLQPGLALSGELAVRIRKEIGRRTSPAHVPAVIADVAELPATHSGKRSESAVRAAVNGLPVRNRDALANPLCLDVLAEHPALQAAMPPVGEAAGRTLEQELQTIWESVFGMSPIGLDDDFFELGGHSLLAMAMFSKIGERTGRELPIVTVFRAPTIAALAELLRQDGGPGFSCLVPVVAGAGGPPLFLVHGMSGTVLEMSKLLNALRGDTPVYVLQAAGLDPDGRPHERVEAMAAAYLAQIRAVQPHGPYSLSGFSFGGLVVYEIARLLAEAGEEVALLALLDTDVNARNLKLRDWIAI
ncbi:MAG: acetoacetate--CoA ligase, partial [Pseudomonadota bacterium]|nr:acetoacetate--CoA ligase [Pseudomonadota bacterium]